MSDRFIEGLGRHLLFWSGWVFTVLGGVASIWIGWIGTAVALVGLIALTGFAFEKHRDLAKATKDHEARKHAWQKQDEDYKRRVQELEGLLQQLPAETLLRIQRLLAAASIAQLAAALLDHVGYVERMVRFVAANPTTNLRTFVRQSGSLFAVARIEATAMTHLEDGDPFVLMHKDPRGLQTASARLVVHQRNEPEKAVWFVVDAFLGDEMPHLDALASTRDVAGLTGYTVRPLCDVERYGKLDFANAVAFVRILLDELTRGGGIGK